MSLSIFVETTCSKSALETATPECAFTFSITDLEYSLSQPLPVAKPANLASIISFSNAFFQSPWPCLSLKILFDSLIAIVVAVFSATSFANASRSKLSASGDCFTSDISSFSVTSAFAWLGCSIFTASADSVELAVTNWRLNLL